MRNAIQAVLAGLSGGLEGRAMQRTREDELRRLDEERLYQRQRDSAASERQALQDAVALAEKGYVEQGERAEMQKRATPALQSAMFNAVSSLKGGPMVAPVNPQALQAAAGQFGPAASTVNVGGKTLERAQTPMQERTMLAAQERDADRFAGEQAQEKATRLKQSDVQEQARRVKNAFGAKLTDEQALAVASGAAKISDFVPEEMTEYQRQSLGIQRAGLDIQRDRVNDNANKLPVSAQGKLAGYESGLSMANDLRQMLSTTKNAVGLKGMLWGPLLDRLDPEGVGPRAAIEALSGEIRNQRFGGALTVTEAKFAEKFLPNDRDNYATVIAKLGQLENYLEQKRAGIFAASGVTPPGKLFQREEQATSKNDPNSLFTKNDSVRNPYRD